MTPVPIELPPLRPRRHRNWRPILARSGKMHFPERYSSVGCSFASYIDFAHPKRQVVKTTLMSIVNLFPGNQKSTDLLPFRGLI